MPRGFVCTTLDISTPGAGFVEIGLVGPPFPTLFPTPLFLFFIAHQTTPPIAPRPRSAPITIPAILPPEREGGAAEEEVGALPPPPDPGVGEMVGVGEVEEPREGVGEEDTGVGVVEEVPEGEEPGEGVWEGVGVGVGGGGRLVDGWSRKK